MKKPKIFKILKQKIVKRKHWIMHTQGKDNEKHKNERQLNLRLEKRLKSGLKRSQPNFIIFVKWKSENRKK